MAEHYFISYSSVDGKTAALRLADDLTADSPSVPVWIDDRELQAAADWDEQVVEALRTCAGLLLLMTTDSVHPKSECKREWTRALRYKKPIVPLLLDPEAEMPFGLEPRQYIDFTGEYRQGLAKLRPDGAGPMSTHAPGPGSLRWFAAPWGVVSARRNPGDPPASARAHATLHPGYAAVRGYSGSGRGAFGGWRAFPPRFGVHPNTPLPSPPTPLPYAGEGR